MRVPFARVSELVGLFASQEPMMLDPSLPPLDDKQPAVDLQRLAYSVDQAAKLVSISRRQLYEEIGSGRLLTKKVGKRRLVLSEDLRNWLQTRPSG